MSTRIVRIAHHTPQKTTLLTLAPVYAPNLRGQRWYVFSSSYCPFIRLSTLAECLLLPANPTYRIRLMLRLWVIYKDSNTPQYPPQPVRPVPA